MGIGDWGLGIGDWGLGLGIGPNPQSPIPYIEKILIKIYIYIYILNLLYFLPFKIIDFSHLNLNNISFYQNRIENLLFLNRKSPLIQHKKNLY